MFREAEHLVGDLGLVAEPSQLEDLKEAVLERVRHRPAHVHQEHDAVVLPVLLDDLRQEDIVMGAVLVQLVEVQVPRLLGTLTADLVRSLPALKLHSQLTDKRIGLVDELAVVGKWIDSPVVVLLQVSPQHGGRDDEVTVVLRPGEDDGVIDEFVAVLLADAITDIRSHLVESLLRLTLTLILSIEVLLQLLLNFRVVVEDLGDCNALVKRGHAIDGVDDVLLVIGEVQVDEAGDTPLEVDVEAVQERGLGEVGLAEAEHILVVDLLVAQEEVAASAGVLVLHQLLDANVLDDVGDPLKHLDDVALLLRSSKQLLAALIGSPQGVADLVRHEHGLHGFGHIPHRHDEVAGLDIKRGGLRLAVKGERQVFGGESAGKDGERIVHGVILPHGGMEVNW